MYRAKPPMLRLMSEERDTQEIVREFHHRDTESRKTQETDLEKTTLKEWTVFPGPSALGAFLRFSP